ncbi:alpha-L-fucosidase [Glycomyces luteolus]|uniref:alpha-L-fucosidase n=1 Tax=Glycomyces luteolus TaxID=2670330 RepID=A0A9X3P9Q4_9ACTN|nr:alpha-L-fucosidase [Glycomyces luteolus]MDA1360952.1 alpha-L-fucosidase [Glycomyces luteolus]
MEHRFSEHTRASLPDRVRAWQQAKFGMFIHWGLYAIPARGEWVQFAEGLPAEEYGQYAPQFDPSGFDAAEWVALAKAAGQKYLVFTAKHHDGFCMWNTALTDYNIVKASPFGRDPIAELAAECERQGLTFGVYYSVKDWHHQDYPTRYTYRTKRHPDGFHGRPKTDADFMKYMDYMEGQLRELMTGYGRIGTLWFDWYGDAFEREDERERARQIIDMVHDLQPDCVVNDRLGGVGADFTTAEQTIPGSAGDRPWEACMTVAGSWGYSANDTVKDGPTLIRDLVDIAGKGGNYLLNVGPNEQGRIGEAEAASLREVGRWLEANGESVHGTAAGPSMRWEPNLAAATRRPGKEYLHLDSWPEDGRIFYNQALRTVTGAYLLADPECTPLPVDVHHRSVMIRLPAEAPASVGNVIVLSYEEH